jgi:hypothetical protein
MKIFPTQEASKTFGTKNTGDGNSIKKNGGGKKKPLPEKAPISESEIREKLAAHVETSNTAKSSVLKKNAQKLGEGFLNPEMKPQQSRASANVSKIDPAAEESEEKSDDSHLLKTDINLNDPKDPSTQEKLKTVLSTGAFSFNPRERETLEKILSGN